MSVAWRGADLVRREGLQAPERELRRDAVDGDAAGLRAAAREVRVAVTWTTDLEHLRFDGERGGGVLFSVKHRQTTNLHLFLPF